MLDEKLCQQCADLETENGLLRDQIANLKLELNVRAVQAHLSVLDLPTNMMIAFALVEGGKIEMTFTEKGRYVSVNDKHGEVLWQSVYGEPIRRENPNE